MDHSDNENNDVELFDGPRPPRGEQNYAVLSQDDIRRIQEEKVTELSNTLSISRTNARMILRHYNWDTDRVHEEWFADEDGVSKAVGGLDKPVADAVEASNNATETMVVLCGICFESYSRGEMRAAACGHPFFRDCCRGYISTTISDGPGCLALRCPDPSCSISNRQDMVERLIDSAADKEKYSTYLVRSYVEGNKKEKWCPVPGCDFAEISKIGSKNKDVCCKWGHAFCWNCGKEAHRPVACETVAKWILKNMAESENTTWILTNS